jgi:hypothetical protein
MVRSKSQIQGFAANWLQSPGNQFNSDPGNSMGMQGQSKTPDEITNGRMAGRSSCSQKSPNTAKRLEPELTPESHIKAFGRPFREQLEHKYRTVCTIGLRLLAQRIE